MTLNDYKRSRMKADLDPNVFDGEHCAFSCGDKISNHHAVVILGDTIAHEACLKSYVSHVENVKKMTAAEWVVKLRRTADALEKNPQNLDEVMNDLEEFWGHQTGRLG